MNLLIGRGEADPDWKILNIQAGPDVDYFGNCTKLFQYSGVSIEAIYAAHVFGHLDYQTKL